MEITILVLHCLAKKKKKKNHHLHLTKQILEVRVSYRIIIAWAIIFKVVTNYLTSTNIEWVASHFLNRIKSLACN